MKCQFCGYPETQVLESRVSEEGGSVRRRRECGKCKKRFTTYEEPKNSVLWVVKRDGRRECFEKEKLKRGILRSLEKRAVSMDLVESMVDEIEREMLGKKSEEVTSRIIGKVTLRKLKRIDKVAWLRFASVYLNFEDLEDFEEAMGEKE
jgi:transcriptional repressor NrdR